MSKQRTLQPCGTRASYLRGCHCDLCLKANATRTRERRRTHGHPPVKPEQHGTVTGYDYGCHCVACAAAHAFAVRQRYRNVQDLTPDQRDHRRAIARKSATKMRSKPSRWTKVKANARRVARERRDLLQAIKLERGCKDCGYKGCAEALDFDHRDPATKQHNISRVKTCALKVLLAEVDKCDVVCANCHRVRTARRREQRMTRAG